MNACGMSLWDQFVIYHQVIAHDLSRTGIMVITSDVLILSAILVLLFVTASIGASIGTRHGRHERRERT